MVSATALRKSTPLLGVDRIEPAVEFWKKLGLAPKVEIPDPQADGRLAFVILEGPGIEIMYQTMANLREDLVKAASIKDAFPTVLQRTMLFVEVSELREVERQLHGHPVIMPRRTTFYGTVEMAYADPAGNVVIFAEAQSQD